VYAVVPAGQQRKYSQVSQTSEEWRKSPYLNFHNGLGFSTTPNGSSIFSHQVKNIKVAFIYFDWKFVNLFRKYLRWTMSKKLRFILGMIKEFGRNQWHTFRRKQNWITTKSQWKFSLNDIIRIKLRYALVSGFANIFYKLFHV